MTKRIYTPEQEKQIQKMAAVGMSDGLISKEIGISIHTVQILTTKYWNDKMKNKDNDE